MSNNKITHILFVCHGNICRSPMAEFIFRELVSRRGREDDFDISSAAVSYEEEGNGLYPPAASTLSRHGIPFGRHRAHRITLEEAEAADLLVVMDDSNLRLLSRIIGKQPLSNSHKLLEFAGENGDVADPWYTGNFEKAYSDILRGCKALLERLCSTGK